MIVKRVWALSAATIAIVIALSAAAARAETPTLLPAAS